MTKPRSQQPDHITPEIAKSDETAKHMSKEQRNLKKQGRQGNTYINTHHEGYQQDR